MVNLAATNNLELAIHQHRTTNANGQFSFTGFLGEYEVSVGSRKTIFSLKEKGESHISVKF